MRDSLKTTRREISRCYEHIVALSKEEAFYILYGCKPRYTVFSGYAKQCDCYEMTGEVLQEGELLITEGSYPISTFSSPAFLAGADKFKDDIRHVLHDWVMPEKDRKEAIESLRNLFVSFVINDIVNGPVEEYKLVPVPVWKPHGGIE